MQFSCLPQETVYFACQLKYQESLLRLCGVPGKTLQYRHKSKTGIELVYPAESGNGWSQMVLAQYSRFQTDRYELSFTLDRAIYTVFDYNEEGVREAGVRTTLPDGQEQERRCQGKVTGSLSSLINIVPCDKDSALSSGSCN